MKKLLLFFFLISCASPNLNYNDKSETFNFDQEMTFEEFNNLLFRYAKISSYPNID